MNHSQNNIFLCNIKVSGKKIIFYNENINKSNFYRNKRLFKIDDIDVNKKKNFMVKNVHLNTLLDIMMMMSLDPYV